jgi:hypothetical protein
METLSAVYRHYLYFSRIRSLKTSHFPFSFISENTYLKKQLAYWHRKSVHVIVCIVTAPMSVIIIKIAEYGKNEMQAKPKYDQLQIIWPQIMSFPCHQFIGV